MHKSAVNLQDQRSFGSCRWNLPVRAVSLRQADRAPPLGPLQLPQVTPRLCHKPANMDNISDIVDDTRVHDERGDGGDSPDREPGSGALYREAQVDASADGERSSPDYMDIRDGAERSSSSSSSSDDEEQEAEEEAEEKKAEPFVELRAKEVSSDAHDGSRRSSASSASSEDAPVQPGDAARDTDDGARKHDYSLKTLENVTLDGSSQPVISLFVKVRGPEVFAGEASAFFWIFFHFH